MFLARFVQKRAIATFSLAVFSFVNLQLIQAEEDGGVEEIPIKAPPPRPALRMPDNAQWTIFFQPNREKAREDLVKKGRKKSLEPDDHDSEGGASSDEKLVYPKKITVTKNGKTYRERTQWSNGKVTEKWILDAYQVLELPNVEGLTRVGLAGRSPYLSDYSRSDFEDLEWISNETYKGAKRMGGVDLYEYIYEPPPRPQMAEAPSGDDHDRIAVEQESRKVAYIGVNSQRPYYYDDGEYVRVYSYSSGPVEKLVLPEKFAKEFRAWQEEINSRKRKVSR